MSDFINKILLEARFKKEFLNQFKMFPDDPTDLTMSMEKILAYYLPNAIFDETADKNFPKTGNWDDDYVFYSSPKEIINLEDLVYSQEYIEPTKSETKKPLFVIEIKGVKYLFDGYHRVVDALFNGQKQMMAYIQRFN